MKSKTKRSKERDAQRLIASLTRSELVKRFPKCFAPKRTLKAPLKIGIFDDVVAAAPDIKPAWIKIALRDYVYGPTYKGGMVQGALRIDLTGEAVGEVTEDQANAARKRFIEMSARWAAATKSGKGSSCSPTSAPETDRSLTT